jgi:hypothetical protein
MRGVINQGLLFDSFSAGTFDFSSTVVDSGAVCCFFYAWDVSVVVSVFPSAKAIGGINISKITIRALRIGNVNLHGLIFQILRLHKFLLFKDRTYKSFIQYQRITLRSE